MEQTTLEEPATVEYSFEFRGNTGEFFKIWTVNMLLTIVTLGVFSAWAKVRTKRYFNGNTFLDGGNFDYHANPWAILFARVLVLGTTGIVAYWAGENVLKNVAYSTLLVVFLPWAYVRGLAFNARNTSFSGLRFSFRKTYGVTYIIYLPVIVAVLSPAYYLAINYWGDYADAQSFFVEILKIQGIFWGGVLLLFPMMIRALHRFRACGHSFGGMSFDFRTPSVWRYYAASVLYIVAIIGLLYLHFEWFYKIVILLHGFLQIHYVNFPRVVFLMAAFVWGCVFSFLLWGMSALRRYKEHYSHIPFGWGVIPTRVYYTVMFSIFIAVMAALYFLIFFVWTTEFMIEILGGVYLEMMLSLSLLLFILIWLIVMVLALFIFSAYFRLFWNNLTFLNGRVQCNFSAFQFALKIITVNAFAITFSLGLLYPWAKVRRARYLAEHIKIIAPAGALQEVIAARSKKEGALGEEMSTVEGFDFDVGLI